MELITIQMKFSYFGSKWKCLKSNKRNCFSKISPPKTFNSNNLRKKLFYFLSEHRQSIVIHIVHVNIYIYIDGIIMCSNRSILYFCMHNFWYSILQDGNTEFKFIVFIQWT